MTGSTSAYSYNARAANYADTPALLPGKRSGFLGKETIEFLGLFLLSALIVYYAPQIIGRIFFLVILLLYYRSKKNYFWIALAILFISTPAGFFSGSTAADIRRLPIYTIAPGMSFSFIDLFLIISIIKSLTQSSERQLTYYFNKSLILIILYGIFLMIYSLILGMPFSYIIEIGRTTIIPFIFFVLASRLINDTESFTSLFKLILPFVILSFSGQLYEISTGNPIIALIKPMEASGIAPSGSEPEKVARFFDAVPLNTLSIIFCCFFLLGRIYIFRPFWLFLSLSMSYFVCYSSATRGYFIAYSFILLFFVLFLLFRSAGKGRTSKYFFLLVTILITGFFILNRQAKISEQMELASGRLSTINLVLQGDVTAGGTNMRIDVRAPRVLSKFKESPIIGWGFSYEGYSYSDSHVGIPNMLLEIGIIGFIIFLYWIYQVLIFPLRLSYDMKISPWWRMSLRFLTIVLGSLLIIHSTSSQLFGFNIGFGSVQKWIMLAIIFTGFNVFIKETYSSRFLIQENSCQ